MIKQFKGVFILKKVTHIDYEAKASIYNHFGYQNSKKSAS